MKKVVILVCFCIVYARATYMLPSSLRSEKAFGDVHLHRFIKSWISSPYCLKVIVLLVSSVSSGFASSRSSFSSTMFSQTGRLRDKLQVQFIWIDKKPLTVFAPWPTIIDSYMRNLLCSRVRKNPAHLGPTI